MSCGELEVMLCDYVDGALDPAGIRTVEEHLKTCASCAALARDGRQLAGFVERTAGIEPPAELLARILTETGSGRHGRLGRAKGIGGWLENLLAPALQPRLVMGMALTVVSFTMMARCAGISPRQLQPSDMDPARIWASLDDRTHRAWARSVKFYEDIKFVYEIQSRIRDWSDQQDEEERSAEAKRPVEDRKLPAASGQARPPAPPGLNSNDKGRE